MEWIFAVLGLIVGSVLTAVVLVARYNAGNSVLRRDLNLREEQLQQSESERESLRSETETLRITKAQMQQELRSEQEKLQWTEAATEQLREAFTALAHRALTSNADQFLTRSREQLASLLDQVRGDWGTQKEELKGLVAPLEKSLTTLDGQIRAIEEKREGAYKGLEAHLRHLGEAQSRLQHTTVTLEQAMKSSTARGRWGELQLRRVVELAGMVQHVDFQEQVTAGAVRPDMVVRLPNGGELPVDAKAPATAYLEAVQLDGDARKARLIDHAKALKLRIQELARKEYQEAFERSPELVVMFVPFESAISAAFEADPELLDYGIRQRVLIASPVTLLALLRTVAFGWQQYQIAENAREIAQQGRDLYARILNVLKPIREIGANLTKTVNTYNKAVGSIESRLLPGARRFAELTASEQEPPAIEPVDHTPRSLLEAPHDD